MVGEETDVFSLVTFCAGFSTTTPPELFWVGLLTLGLVVVGFEVGFLLLWLVVSLEVLWLVGEFTLELSGFWGSLILKQPERVIKNVAIIKQQIDFLNIKAPLKVFYNIIISIFENKHNIFLK